MTLEKERHHTQDIKVFIESQLRFEEDVDAEILRGIRVEILEKSSGIFLWVNLVVHQLNEVQRQGGTMEAVKKRLRQIPEAAKQRAGPNGAMALYGLFKDIIEKDQKDIDELVRIIQIVFCARRPLHPKELYVLINQAYTNPFDFSLVSDNTLTKRIRQVSKGLAEVTTSLFFTVQFIHETVREFIRDGGLNIIPTNSVETQSVNCYYGHEVLKVSCLKQIHAPVAEHLEPLSEYRRRGHYRNTKVNPRSILQSENFLEQATEKFPFLEYASKNILFHAEEAQATEVSQSEFLESFPMAEWVPIYNLFQKVHTRRYCDRTTSLLYILAEFGHDHLIKISDPRRQYIQEVIDNEFSSALECAIYNGNLDSVWTLAGLNAKSRPQDIVAPLRRDYKIERAPLPRLLLNFGDGHLLRRALEDSDRLTVSLAAETSDLWQLKSAEMIDLLLEVSVVPGFPSVGHRHEHSQVQQIALKHQRSNGDLPFIRRAIEEKPSLLTSNSWGGQTMLRYAVDQRLQPLVSLYLEYSDGGQHGIDAVLLDAAAIGDLGTMEFVDRFAPNFGSQDGDGRTALHLAAVYFAESGGQDEAPLQYLLSKEPSCVNVLDSKGQTALAVAAHGRFQPFQRQPGLLKTFLHAGANPNVETRLGCLEGEEHYHPLIILFTHLGDITNTEILVSEDRCNLNGRDHSGQTALSWCFTYHYKNIEHMNALAAIGEQLLRKPAVDVNSRDKFDHTILEHFIRRPPPFVNDLKPDFRSFVQRFFRSNLLDPNLRTSNDMSPLELIVSLDAPEPAEFGGVIYPASIIFSGRQAFNQHLIEASKLLLGTGKVDINVQRRCAERALPELRGVILSSLSR